MKFLFIIQGEGRGHLTQAMTLEKMLLSKGHEVVAMLVGKSPARQLPDFFRKGVSAPIHQFQSVNFQPSAENRTANMLKSVDVNGRGAVIAGAYETAEEAVENATKITMSDDSTQTYTFKILAKSVDGAGQVVSSGTIVYGATAKYDSVAAAMGCTLVAGDATDSLNDTVIFSTAAEGNTLVIMTNNHGTVNYYAYTLVK